MTCANPLRPPFQNSLLSKCNSSSPTPALPTTISHLRFWIRADVPSLKFRRAFQPQIVIGSSFFFRAAARPSHPANSTRSASAAASPLAGNTSWTVTNTVPHPSTAALSYPAPAPRSFSKHSARSEAQAGAGISPLACFPCLETPKWITEVRTYPRALPSTKCAIHITVPAAFLEGPNSKRHDKDGVLAILAIASSR